MSANLKSTVYLPHCPDALQLVNAAHWKCCYLVFGDNADEFHLLIQQLPTLRRKIGQKRLFRHHPFQSFALLLTLGLILGVRGHIVLERISAQLTLLTPFTVQVGAFPIWVQKIAEAEVMGEISFAKITVNSI